jgi:hypothetical protein
MGWLLLILVLFLGFGTVSDAITKHGEQVATACKPSN